MRLQNATPEQASAAMRAGPHLLVILAHTDVTFEGTIGPTIGFHDDSFDHDTLGSASYMFLQRLQNADATSTGSLPWSCS